LETALKLDANNPQTLCKLAELKLAIGQAASAEKLAAKAAELAPENDVYRLQWSQCLKQLARYDRAVEETRAVLEGKTATPVIRAAALEHMGVLAALGSKEVQERAVPLHNKAIELADGLAASDEPAVATAANQILLNAHLSIAERIAVGDWQGKDEVVGQWISRASALAEQMIVTGQGDVSLRLQVAVSALTAGGRLQPPVDPKLWVAEAEQAAADYEATIDGDAHACDVMNWQLGMAYFHAAEIQHRRGEAALAIRYGELADATLSPLAEKRSELPDTRYALGRLYFQNGAVHAVHQHDHDMACQWYDRASTLLMEPVPFTTLANPGQHGDALVSMGVSYWEVGQRERAYELTEAGVQLVEQGVAEGLISAETLAVPQGNLNAMARALGKAELSTPQQATEDQTQMARKSRSSSRSQARTAGRSATSSGARRR
jgi:tetratricopeptide (TPR) repeat protein